VGDKGNGGDAEDAESTGVTGGGLDKSIGLLESGGVLEEVVVGNGSVIGEGVSDGCGSGGVETVDAESAETVGSGRLPVSTDWSSEVDS